MAVPDVRGAQETERVALTPGVEPLVDRLGEMVLLFAPLRARDPNRVGPFGIASAELVAKQLTELGMVRVAPEIPVDTREKSAVAFQALQEVGGVGASRDFPAERGADVFETCGFHQETLHVVRLFEEHLRRQEVVHVSRGFFGQTSCSCLDHQAGRPTVGAFGERRRVDVGLLGVLQQASRLLNGEPEVPRVDLDRSAFDPEPVQGDVGPGSSRDQYVHRGRQCVDELAQAVVRVAFTQYLCVVEHEVARFGRLGAEHSHQVENRARRRVVELLARRTAVVRPEQCPQRVRDVGPEGQGLGVALVEREPRALLGPARVPRREEHRLAGAGRSVHDDDRRRRRDVESTFQPVTGHVREGKARRHGLYPRAQGPT